MFQSKIIKNSSCRNYFKEVYPSTIEDKQKQRAVTRCRKQVHYYYSLNELQGFSFCSISAILLSYPIVAASLSPSGPPGPFGSALWRRWCRHPGRQKGPPLLPFPPSALSAASPEGPPEAAGRPGEPLLPDKTTRKKTERASNKNLTENKYCFPLCLPLSNFTEVSKAAFDAHLRLEISDSHKCSHTIIAVHHTPTIRRVSQVEPYWYIWCCELWKALSSKLVSDISDLGCASKQHKYTNC